MRKVPDMTSAYDYGAGSEMMSFKITVNDDNANSLVTYHFTVN